MAVTEDAGTRKFGIVNLAMPIGLGMAILAGIGFGQLLPEKNGFWFAAFLGFGVAALLYLVIEELITEAHATKDTPFNHRFVLCVFFNTFDFILSTFKNTPAIARDIIALSVVVKH